MKKNVYIIAGPNGSGKTTFAKLFLPEYVHCPNFVNADLIAQGLAPFEPRSAAIKAGRLVLQQIHDFSERGIDFAKGILFLFSFCVFQAPNWQFSVLKIELKKADIMCRLKMSAGDFSGASTIFLRCMSHCLMYG